MTLTAAGWPRPIVDGLPIPWVSPSDALSTMELARADLCATGAICAVCGLPHEDEPAYVLVKSKTTPPDLACIEVQAMDNGILHRRCLLLALAHCPKLRELNDTGELRIVRTTASRARAVKRARRKQAVIDGADCEVVERDAI